MKVPVNPFAAQPQLFLQQAISHHQRGQFAEAQRIYEAVLKAQPRNTDALHLLGVLASQTKQHERAVELIGKAIAANPKAASFHSNLANSLLALGRAEEALESYDRAVALKPDMAEAWSNRSNALRRLLRAEEALASCDRSLELRLDYVDALINRGHALRQVLRVVEATQAYDRAIELAPQNAAAHWALALARLTLGDLERGWEEFEWGWKAGERGEPRPFTQPLWLGKEPLEGKTILLHNEQGFGDMIQFSRYATLVAQRGAKVLLTAPHRLASVIKTIDGVSEVFTLGDQLPPFDVQCPVMSLPLAFGTRVETIPAWPHYVHSDPALVREWEARLGPRTKPRVGIVWGGNTANMNDYRRSMTLADLLPLASGDVDVVSLQKDVSDADRAVLAANRHIRHFGEEQQGFGDAAAMCELTDVVVSVDTAVAHLSAALGRPTWVMLNYAPDWRWMLDRDDSPWYPSVKLYRQTTLGDWAGVVARVAADLQRLSAD